MEIMGNGNLLMQKTADFLWERQKVTLDNIANSSTPGYKAKYVTFEEELKSKLSLANSKKASQMKNDILGTNMFVHGTPNESYRLDGNNVNVDAENVELARAALEYQYVLQSFNNDYSRLRGVIRGQ